MRINPDLAHMTPARAKELLAGDIEGYRLPIIELIERQAAEIELLKDAGAWRGLTGQVQALQAEIERLRVALGRITRLDTARADFGLACAQDIAAQQHDPEQQPDSDARDEVEK